MLKMDETSIDAIGCEFNYLINEKPPKFIFDEINDIEVTITEDKISFQDNIWINGSFGELNFIGFDSVLPSSWVVQKSKFFSK